MHESSESSLKSKLFSLPLLWKLSGLFVGQMLLVLLAMFYFSWKTNLALIDETTRELQIKAGTNISDKISSFLDSALINNYHNALLARERNYSPVPAHWKSVFIAEVSQSKTISNVALATETGDYFGIDKLDTGKVVHQRADQKTGHDLVSTVINESGESGKELSRVSHYDPRTRPWFKSATASRSQGWSDIYKNYADDALQLAASYPLYDSSNTLKGVLVSAVRLTYLSRYLHSVNFSKDAHIIIVDHKGLLVASTSKSPLYQSKNGIINRLSPRESIDPYIRVMAEALGDESSTTSVTSYGGRRFNLNTTTFRHPLGLSWKIISAVPNESLLGYLTHQQSNMHISIGILFLLSLGCSYWMGRHVVTPLLALNRAVNDYAKGSSFQLEPLERNDELGQLTISFRNMAEENSKLHENLRNNIDALEETNKTLRITESKFRTLFNSSNDAIFVRSFINNGEAGLFIEVNDTACNRLGYRREQLLQMSTEDINISESCHCLENIRSLLATQGMIVFESAHRTSDGRIIPVEISSHQFLLEGNPVILSVARDITERKSAEKEHSDTTERFKKLAQQQTTIFDASPVGIAIVTDRIIVSANKTFCEMMGYSLEEVLSKSTRLFYPSQDAFEKFGRESYPRFVEGKISHTETDFRRKNGSHFTASITGGTIDPHELSIGSIWIFEDISERRCIEDNLRKLTRAVEQSPVAIIITDLAGTIEFVNPWFTHITGYTAEEVIGKNPRILKSDKTPPDVFEKLWSTVSSGNIWEGELSNKSKDGTLFWEHATISPLRNKDGIVSHYLAIKEDITEKKNVFDQLVQSQKVESIGQLAGGLAHDFNNILSIISGYAYLMKFELEKDSEQSPYLEKILSASAKAAELTRALLAYSRKQLMNPENQNLNLLVTTVGSFITRLIGEHIKFTVTTQGAPLMVYVDALQIEQVLMNLATNARDAMPDGGTFSIATTTGGIDEAYISTHGYGEIGHYAMITVSDTGCGMSADTVQRIFDPFYTTKEVGKGTGLGMSMVMGIVKQHKGFIDVRSEPGVGAEFRIFLPLLEGDFTKTVAEADQQLESGEGTILVAEDEPEVRAYMEALLTKHGYTVILAVDGQDAVDQYAAHKDDINLVILDMVMPRKSGKAAYDEIRLTGSTTECLFISGYTSDLIQRRGDLGATAVLLTKPIQPHLLLSRIAEILHP